MSRISVKLRVTAWYIFIMIVMSAIVLAAMTSISQEMMDRDIKGRIINVVDSYSRRVFTPNRKNSISSHLDFYEGGVHMVLYDDELNIVGGQTPFGLEQDYELNNGMLKTKSHNGNNYYIYDKEIRLPNRKAYWLKGYISVTDESYAVKAETKNNLILTVIFILTAGVGGYIIISRAFVPVSKISRTAKEIADSSDLSRRINIGKGNDEIFSLANTFDEMLDKIEQTFEREKQFTSDASHELRTPVAVILSECEYMEECAKSEEEFKESARSIKRQTEKMSKLISELLMISRMDKNTLQLDFEETDLSELLAFVCDEQEEIRDSGITLERNIMTGIITKADRVLIARLFINIISNAYQYSKNDGLIKVLLSGDCDNVIFSVEDNGIGISEENMPKIWERFYQVDKSRTSNEDGSMGLGLSMVKWIVQCHGGSVEVKSEIGKGSTFTFVFPKSK